MIDYSFQDYTTNPWKKLIGRFLPAKFERIFAIFDRYFSTLGLIDRSMKRFRRWQRISFLFLLSLSVFVPIFLLSIKLQSFTSEGRKEFIDDLPTIKYRADVLPLEAVGQEGREGVKEPNLEVYRDQNNSLVKFSQNEDGHSNSKESRASSSRGSERRATELGRGGETKPTQPREERSPRKLKQGHSNQSSSQHDHGVRATSVQMVPHVQNSRTETQRVRDDKVGRMKDQVIRAKAYLGFATSAGNTHLVRELRLRIKEVERALSRARKDSDLSRRASQKMRSMERTLSKASRAYSDCTDMVNSLRSMANNAESQTQLQRNHVTRLTELVGRTTPKGLHCLSMRLTADYFTLEPEQQVFPNQQNIYNPDLLHYAVFSDNVLAAAVVVNSTVSNTKEPGKSVFHVVTDSLNFPAFSMWFLLNPPREATIHVLSVKDFVWLSTTYDVSLGKQRSIDPRHSSLLNHLRFDLPEMFPQLNKIIFLDHDVVVQKDLSGLFKIKMKGKVNGAVETCLKGESSYRQMDMLINFSDPWVTTKLDANACTWAFGMNLFDLSQWRHKDLTASYRRLLLMGNGKPLWTAGSLPLGWITFYNETLPLDKRWHLLGLGYDSQLRAEEIKQAAVIHYDGIMKPWLDIGISRYKSYWNKYINFDHPLLQQCNLHG